MISISGLVCFVLYVVVLGLICWLLVWLVDYLAPPEPFRKVARAAVVVVGVLILIVLLLNLIGRGPAVVP